MAAPGRAEPAVAGGLRLDPQNVIPDDIQAEALAAYVHHAARMPFRGSEVVIVDYRKPSNEPRLFILNMRSGAVEAYYVAHGRGSDPGHTQVAMRFSDAPTTGMSSVGAFRGLERYQSPDNGPALRLAGLDWTNANAYDRLIVFHTAGYFDPAARRFGRSCGCFVVTRPAMERVYGVLADGGFLYAGPARLHDRTASAAQDCDPHCGGNCSGSLMARRRADKPVAVARAEPAPRPAPPVPRAKPGPAAPPVAVAMAESGPAVIVPRAKPRLPEPAPAIIETATVPTPLAKPDLSGLAVAAVVSEPSEAPIPLAKPALDATGVADEITVAAGIDPPSRVVPDPAPGEIPVPSAKPAGLRQVAELRP